MFENCAAQIACLHYFESLKAAEPGVDKMVDTDLLSNGVEERSAEEASATLQDVSRGGESCSSEETDVTAPD